MQLFMAKEWKMFNQSVKQERMWVSKIVHHFILSPHLPPIFINNNNNNSDAVKLPTALEVQL